MKIRFTQPGHLLIVTLLMLAISSNVFAQDTKLKIVIEPENIELAIGSELQLKGTLVNEKGEVVEGDLMFYARRSARRGLSISNDGLIKAIKAGTYTLYALKPGDGDDRILQAFQVVIPHAPISEVSFTEIPSMIYAKAKYEIGVNVTDEAGFDRPDETVNYSSSNSKIADYVDGKLIAKKDGKVTISAEVEGVKAEYSIKVDKNPVASVSIKNEETSVRTGDVVNFDAIALDKKDKAVDGMPITYTFVAEPDDQFAPVANGQISQSGKFVANVPGDYTLIATAGGQSTEQTIRVDARDVKRRIEMVGHAPVLDVHTSDLWVWEGVDGRDYAITGTWGANGQAYFWDVTDPSNMFPIDTVTVDARTVNDVKISEDGRIGVLTREGASNRKNGIVILDVSNPRDVKVISEYTEGLTGGVHNSFIYDNHVYAVNNGRRYDIINIEDPANPVTVSRFELDTPGHAIHDVWIEDGIAYSSNWSDGVVAVDVGSGIVDGSPEKTGVAGGSPENPVYLGSFQYPSGWNHAAFPFKSKSTGQFYVIAGDEAFPDGLNPYDRNPDTALGWIHFIKFDGWENADEVARYQIPEAGTHNFWVVDDLLFVAYYNAGLRIVDISGELMGNLYDQGREIGKFIPTHPESMKPNAPFTWGPQPHKGHIFISDWNSGLWAIKLIEEESSVN